MFAVVAATREAIRRGSAGEGATLLEAITYRMGAHTTSDDPTRYRTEEELKPWVERDPIERMHRHLVQAGQWDQARDEELRAEFDRAFRQDLGPEGVAFRTMYLATVDWQIS